MALVEIYHVVAASRAVADGQQIKEGQFVTLDSSGEVAICDGTTDIAYGVAGDTKLTSESGMPGVYAGWQNRVSDYFDETKASGKMTVYHSGGEFATDQFVAEDTTDEDAIDGDTNYMAPLFVSPLGTLCESNGTDTQVVAYLLTRPGAYISGVPGVDVNGDQALKGDNSNQYFEYKLVI